MSSSSRVFAGLLLGALTGLALAAWDTHSAEVAASIAQPIGRLWLNALQMTIVPLVMTLLVIGVTGARSAAASGRVARRAMLWFIAVLLCAAIYAAVLAPVYLSWLPHNPGLMQALHASTQTPLLPTTGLASWFANIIPSNAVAAAAAGSIVPLVVFTLFFAFALTQIEGERRQRIVDLCQAVADAMIVIVHWILKAGPIGVFALILPVSAQAGIGVLGALGFYILMQCLLYIGAMIGMVVLACIAGGEPLRRFASGILPAQVVAASTQSSLASLPAMVDAADNRLGYPTPVTALVLPMAVSLFRITSPIQYLGVMSFVAWAYGIDLSLAQTTLAVLLSVVISIGSVGLPGQASFMGTNLPVVQSVGLPIEPLGLLLAVDLIPDVFATLANVTADLTVTSRVARAEMADNAKLPPLTPL